VHWATSPFYSPVDSEAIFAPVEPEAPAAARGGPCLRYVTLDRVHLDAFATNSPDPAAYSCSRPADGQSIDALISHSWQDQPQAKWQALQRWRRAFVAQHGREPRVFIDKYCLRQSQISSELRHLAFYASQCDSIVALVGGSFPKRLWCVIELDLFLSRPEARCTLLHLVPSAARRFDVREAQCACDVDKERLLGLVLQRTGSYDAFNRRILSALQGAHERSVSMHVAR